MGIGTLVKREKGFHIMYKPEYLKPPADPGRYPFVPGDRVAICYSAGWPNVYYMPATVAANDATTHSLYVFHDEFNGEYDKLDGPYWKCEVDIRPFSNSLPTRDNPAPFSL